MKIQKTIIARLNGFGNSKAHGRTMPTGGCMTANSTPTPTPTPTPTKPKPKPQMYF